ncbi:MAG: hypothetical protein SGPRY_003665 [Prymnesium sp.]
MEDEEGIRGVRLSKMIMQIAGDALKANITTLGPLTLPVSEQIIFFFNMLARKAVRGKLPLPGQVRRTMARAAVHIVKLPVISSLVGYKGGASEGGEGEGTASPQKAVQGSSKPLPPLARELPPYVPDFSKAFQWICVHTGGRAVIDAIEKNLSLPPHFLEPSRLSLFRYGNVSSASIWYELELVGMYGNACGAQRDGGALPPAGGERRLQKGDRVWQIAFGSGFKCNSAVWQCLRNH